jgi:hypothetical protein
MRWRTLCLLAVLSCGGQTAPGSSSHDAGQGTDTGPGTGSGTGNGSGTGSGSGTRPGGDNGTGTGSGTGTGTVVDAGEICATSNPSSCVCVCSVAAEDAGCQNPQCSFDHAFCTGPATGCPTGQVCASYGDLCTPMCGDDGGCPAGMGAIHLLP